VNVKHHLWLPDLFAKYEGTGEHEFSDDAGFWAWLHELDDRSDWNAMDSADEWARESCWDAATEMAHEIWPQYSTEHVAEKKWSATTHSMRFTGETVPRKRYHAQVYSEGRSGGWCVVHGLADIESWDAIALGRWARFAKVVKEIAHEGYPYGFIWNLHEHEWETVRTERENLYPAPAYA
jgi:hypothetical protein